MNAIVILVAFAKIVWVKLNNKRCDYGDTTKLTNSLAIYGWVSDNPVPAVKDDKSFGHLTESQLRNEMEQRQTEWTRLKSAVAAQATANNVAELTVFQGLYCEMVNDQLQLIVPEYSGNAGFRRSTAYRPAMVQRFTSKEASASKDILTMIPIRVAFYNSNVERLMDQQRENEIQGTGTKSMDDLEKLSTTKELFDEGCLEVDIRRLYHTSSTAQKLFGICQSNCNWPTLNVYNRFQLPLDDTSGNRIPWGPIRGADLVKWNNRFQAHRKRMEGLPLKKDETQLEPLNPVDSGTEEFDTFLRDKAKGVEGGGNANKIMKKDDIENKAKNHTLLVARDIMQSVYNNSEANLKPLLAHAFTMNTALEMVKAGEGDFTDRLFKAVKDFKPLIADIISLLEKGKAGDLVKSLDLINNQPAIVVDPPRPDQLAVPPVVVETVPPAPPVVAETVPPVVAETVPPVVAETVPPVVAETVPPAPPVPHQGKKNRDRVRN